MEGNRRCETCVFWHHGGPGADTCMKRLTKDQKKLLKSLPASYYVMGGQVHANNGTRCEQWEKKP